MNYPYGKNVFLTGGSSGIGLAAARLLAENGYTVYSASRNPVAEDADVSGPGSGSIKPVALDVRDSDSVAAAAASVLAEADIGIVIHCAGVGIACAGEDYPSEAVENLMQTNFSGVLRVNSAFLPHLRGRGGGLCVITGSVAGLFPVPFQSHYCASKAALDSYAAALRMELCDYGVKVSLIMPGDTNTGFTAARKYEISDDSPLYDDCRRAVGKMEKDELGGRNPVSVARAILKLIARKNPAARKIIGVGYKLLAVLRRLLPGRFVEWILRLMFIGR